MVRVLSNLKLLFTPSEKTVKAIKGGIFKGIKMHLDLTCQTQLYLGLFEKEIQLWIKMFSKYINTAIDIGAGEGEYTLYFLIKTQVTSIFAFEPSQNNRVWIIKNIKLNNLINDTRIKILPKFVGCVNNENSITLNTLLSSISFPCLIKVDVDGSEANVLLGADKLLTMYDIYWVIETHSEQLEYQCIQILNNYGFVTKIVPNAYWRYFIPELRSSAHNRWLIGIKCNAKRAFCQILR